MHDSKHRHVPAAPMIPPSQVHTEGGVRAPSPSPCTQATSISPAPRSDSVPLCTSLKVTPDGSLTTTCSEQRKPRLPKFLVYIWSILSQVNYLQEFTFNAQIFARTNRREELFNGIIKLDTGSAINLITAEFIARCGLLCTSIPREQIARDIHGGLIFSEGMVTIRWRYLKPNRKQRRKTSANSSDSRSFSMAKTETLTCYVVSCKDFEILIGEPDITEHCYLIPNPKIFGGLWRSSPPVVEAGAEQAASQERELERISQEQREVAIEQQEDERRKAEKRAQQDNEKDPNGKSRL